MYILETLVCNEQTNDICPQVDDMGAGYRWDDPDSVTHIIANRPLAVAPNMQSFHLHPATNATDLISQGYIYTMGLLVSQAFCEALKGYAIQPHESYPATIVHRDQIRHYRWLHIIEELESSIDYSESEFTIRRADNTEETVVFTDADDLRRCCRSLVDRMEGTVDVRRIVFMPGIARYDLFCLRLTSLVYVVSDPLASELARRGFTGVTLQRTQAVFLFA